MNIFKLSRLYFLQPTLFATCSLGWLQDKNTFRQRLSMEFGNQPIHASFTEISDCSKLETQYKTSLLTLCNHVQLGENT